MRGVHERTPQGTGLMHVKTLFDVTNSTVVMSVRDYKA